MTLVSGDIAGRKASTTRSETPELRQVEDFGTNPGNLRMWLFEPRTRAKRCPCVIVLHGCTQTARGFDFGSGWSSLADEHGFLVIYPEQQRSNNEKTCFSWFQTEDVSRGNGEVESVIQMLDWVVSERGVDPGSVFVCGLSAGGAMSCAMLAAYPERFAAGAIIAGLPYGAAKNVSEAFDAMFVGRPKEASRWGDLVRGASHHVGPWPRVSVWYGMNDTVVKPINAGELVKQWTNVHGVGAAEPELDHLGRTTRRIWRDADGCECVTDYMVPGIGHGVPIDAIDPPAPFFLPSDISATQQIAEDFGLLAHGNRPNKMFSMLGFAS